MDIGRFVLGAHTKMETPAGSPVTDRCAGIRGAQARAAHCHRGCCAHTGLTSDRQAPSTAETEPVYLARSFRGPRTNRLLGIPVSQRSILRGLPASQHVAGHCYSARLPDGLPVGDSNEDAHGSSLRLFEDGLSLGPPHAPHELITTIGSGTYSHWHNTLYFSSSDNSDPRANGREYHVYVPVVAGPRDSKKHRAVQLMEALPDDFSPERAYAALEQCFAILYPEAKLGEDKKLFWGDKEFIGIYENLCGSNYRSLERKYTVYQLVRSLDFLDGDVAECGAYNGSTAYMLALAGERVRRPRHLHLFDSFEGLSSPTELDGDYWQAGALAVSEEVARRTMQRFGNVSFYRGWIPERFGDVDDRTFCFVHIDVDLYQPTLDSLAFFYPRLVSGGMLVCDDYGFSSCPGATRAVDEFFADKPETVIHIPTGQGFIIKR